MAATHTNTELISVGMKSNRARNRSRLSAYGLVLPGVIGLFASFLVPLFVMIRMSLNENGSGGQLIETFTLASYHKALADPFYWEVVGNTLMLGLVCGLAAVVLSYPIALFLTRTTSRWKGVLIALAIAPLLTSAVARTFGWMAILGDQGVINAALMNTGLLSSPLRLSNNFLGTSIALVEILMPYAILAMISGFGRINSSLEEAAGSLGASKVKVFLRVTLPLSLPGVFTGFLLVFVLAVSSFVTPKLLGGGRVFILATEVYSEATQTLNWPLASALSVILLVVFGAIVAVYQRLIKRFEG
ncbi:ABC transporter permease [Leucobacter chromiiresistens]|uniref:Putative spermidine/putrescine transport system permease protein n=1 Tax=Leucobacter chromiiresistens TaxID=1079994 RepID=A0A1H0XYJ9_9MICO|nr:ABC transporter permease [Leucobacter chromiiresistens]SDQ07984.1 putative spermidine/putrescine transport system permease protein [Leucobacter chromiiresistens]